MISLNSGWLGFTRAVGMLSMIAIVVSFVGLMWCLIGIIKNNPLDSSWSEVHKYQTVSLVASGEMEPTLGFSPSPSLRDSVVFEAQRVKDSLWQVPGFSAHYQAYEQTLEDRDQYDSWRPTWFLLLVIGALLMVILKF